MVKAKRAWIVLGIIEDPRQELTYLVAADSPADAKKAVQAFTGGDRLAMFAAELDQNAIEVLDIETGEVTMWGLDGQRLPVIKDDDLMGPA